MGWTTTNRHGEPVKQFMIRHVLTWKADDAPYTSTVLDCAIVHLTTMYAAVETIYKTTNERKVWAAVILLAYNCADGMDFGYKLMSEDDDPYESQCPQRILDLLTEDTEPHALAWRARCRAAIARSKATAGLVPATLLTVGGRRCQLLVKLGRRGWTARCLDDGKPYRITPRQLMEAIDVVLPNGARPRAAAPAEAGSDAPAPSTQLDLFG